MGAPLGQPARSAASQLAAARAAVESGAALTDAQLRELVSGGVEGKPLHDCRGCDHALEGGTRRCCAPRPSSLSRCW